MSTLFQAVPGSAVGNSVGYGSGGMVSAVADPISGLGWKRLGEQSLKAATIFKLTICVVQTCTATSVASNVLLRYDRVWQTYYY